VQMRNNSQRAAWSTNCQTETFQQQLKLFVSQCPVASTMVNRSTHAEQQKKNFCLQNC